MGDKYYILEYNDIENLVWNHNGENYILTLQINENISQFYYNDPLWTNTTLLNSDYLFVGDKNAKYSAYTLFKVHKYILLMDGEPIYGEFKEDYRNKSVYEWQNTPKTFYKDRTACLISKAYYTNTFKSKLKIFGGSMGTSLYTEEQYLVSELLLGPSYREANSARIGFLCDQYNYGNDPGSLIGVGLYHGYYSPNNLSSGYRHWTTAVSFFASSFWIYPPNWDEILQNGILKSI